jgi:AcrR family transcriptional regulator
MGRRRSFDESQIAAAALLVLDRDGLSGLTMRGVASALGTGPMTLYNYVADREGLEALIVDAVSSEIRLPSVRTGSPGGWEGRLMAIGLAIAVAVRAHPEAAPLLLLRRSMSAESLRPAEALLGALSDAGLAGGELLVAFRTVTAVLMGVIQAELAGPVARLHGETREDALERFSKLDAIQFPHLISVAAAARHSTLKTEISKALRLVIAGIKNTTRAEG